MAKKHGKKTRPEDVLTLPMAPLLDVVMQILCFFVVTYQADKPESHLVVNLPSPSNAPPPKNMKIPKLLEINVLSEDRYGLKGALMSLDNIEETIRNVVSEGDKDATVIVKVSENAKTVNLIRVLDLCGKLEMKNLNVMSYKSIKGI